MFPNYSNIVILTLLMNQTYGIQNGELFPEDFELVSPDPSEESLSMATVTLQNVFFFQYDCDHYSLLGLQCIAYRRLYIYQLSLFYKLQSFTLKHHIQMLIGNFFFNFYFYFILLCNTVLVLPYIDMNPPWVYMCSQT